jgi:DNA-binding GntR family transcriptional regulator
LLAEAVQLAVPGLSDIQVARLAEISSRQDSETSMKTRARLNREFYAVLFAGLGRPRLLEFIEKLETQVERYLLPIQRPHLGHHSLVDACRRRDGVGAAELVREHVTAVGKRAAERVRGVSSRNAPSGDGTISPEFTLSASNQRR